MMGFNDIHLQIHSLLRNFLMMFLVLMRVFGAAGI